MNTVLINNNKKMENEWDLSRVVVYMTAELKKEMKQKAADNGQTIKGFVIQAIKEKLGKV